MNDYVTREEVFDVCNEFWNKWSKPPTQTEVRDLLGKRGSFSTISKYLKEWKASENDRETMATSYDLKIPISVIDQAKGIYKHGYHDGQQSLIEESTKLLEQENQQLREEIMGYKTTCERLEGKQSGYEQIQSDLLNKLEKQAQENAAIKTEMEKLKEQFVEALKGMKKD